jgi:flagellar hook-length control protein FliK
MATPVSNYAANFAVAPTEAPRASSESTFKISFPDLLRGQMNNGVNMNATPIFSPAQSAEAKRNAASNETSSRPTERSEEQEKPRQTTPERQPAHAVTRDANRSQDIRPSTESAGTRDASRPQGSTQDASASHTSGHDTTSTAHANADSASIDDSSNATTTADTEATAQDTVAATVDTTAAVLAAINADPLTHDLPATIAALLAGFAADTPDEATGDERVADDDPLPDPHARGARTPRPSLPATTTLAHPNTDGADPKPAAASTLPATSSSALAPPATQDSAQALTPRADPLAALAARGTAGVQTGAAPPDSPATLFNALRSPTQAASSVPQYAVPTPAGQRGWAEEVGNRVMWMLGQAQSKAELVLTPPSLGKVEVSITLNGDQTTAQFVASSQATRDALEQAMPRLRELLAQSGINLSHTDVGTSGGETQDEAHAAGRRGHHGGANGSIDDDETSASPPGRVQHHDGLVNTFA